MKVSKVTVKKHILARHDMSVARTIFSKSLIMFYGLGEGCCGLGEGCYGPGEGCYGVEEATMD